MQFHKAGEDICSLVDGISGWQHICEHFFLKSFQITAREETDCDTLWVGSSVASNGWDDQMSLIAIYSTGNTPREPYWSIQAKYATENISTNYGTKCGKMLVDHGQQLNAVLVFFKKMLNILPLSVIATETFRVELTDETLELSILDYLTKTPFF